MTTASTARWKDCLLPALVCALGLLCAFSPTLRSGFRRVQTDPGDTRLVNYHLEYGYRWLVRAPAFERLWSPPFYYPERNTAGYGDVEFASLPLYAPWRLLGCEPDTAFQLWQLAAAAANFAAALLLLRRGLGYAGLASLAGAYVIAFGAARTNALNHPQLYSIYYPLLAIYAVCRLLPDSDRGPGPVRWLYLAALCFAAQFYCGFYVAWFTALGGVLAVAVAFARAGHRGALREALRTRAVHFAGAGALVLALLAPLFWHYAVVARAVGAAHDIVPDVLQPRWASWLHPGAESWLYAGWVKHAPFRSLPAEGEHRVGLGVLLTLFACWGWWRERRRPAVVLFAATAFALVLIATRWPGDFSLWERVVARVIPGIGAIRAPVRMGALLSIPLAVGVAAALRRWPAGRFAGALGALLIAALALDQGVTTRTYDKHHIRRDVAAVAAAVRPECKVFLFAPDSTTPFNIAWKYHNDAMWASARLGVPTVNGQAGRIPPTWVAFNDVDVRTPAQRQGLLAALRAWSIEHRIDPGDVCMIEGTMPMDW